MTVTRPPSGVNLTALPSRFSKICLTFAASATSGGHSGAIWTRSQQGNLVLQCQWNMREIGVDRTAEDRAMHYLELAGDVARERQTLAEKLVVDLERGTDRPPHERLSDREFEVLCLIASGKTVGEIAVMLNLSDSTISTYRARILEKMGMKTSAELTHYAIQNKLVD